MRSLTPLVLLVTLACSPSPDAEEAEAPPATEAPAPAPPAPPAITDADIAAIVVAANSIDAELGDLAASKATNAEIREFGRTMSRDHKAVNEQAGALVTRLGVTPTENDVSRKLQSDAAAFRTELEKKTGTEFDRAYIEHEVAYHQAVIDAVDTTLLPNASNAELKQMITEVRPALVAHLEHAKQLAAKVK